MKKMIGLGNSFPKFRKKAVVSLKPGHEFYDITSEDHINSCSWMVFFWWPNDFTQVCPTELAAFNRHFNDFKDRETMLIGASTDSEHAHLAWRKSHELLTDIQYPLLADTSKSLAEELGILTEEERVAYRATYIVDPQGIIRWVSVNDLDVGRNISEVIRVLDALQTDELCPCNWQKGDNTLTPEK